MPSSTHHGNNLRAIRLLRGMKQEVFALAMGVTQQRISRLEKQRKISADCLNVAADILNVSVDAFERFEEDGLFYLGKWKPKGVTGSVKETIDHFKEELSKKDKRIEELESKLALNNGELINNKLNKIRESENDPGHLL